MSDNEENSEDVQVAENEKKKLKAGDINLTITNQTSLDQQKLWDEVRSEIQQKYQALNIPFDPSSITTKSEMEHHVQVLKVLEKGINEFHQEQQAQRSGVPLTGRQTGEDREDTTSDRNISQLKESTKNIPLDLVQYNSVSEMKNLLLEIANDTNDSRQAEAEKLYQKLLVNQVSKSQNLEFQGSGKELIHGKGSWRKKARSED